MRRFNFRNPLSPLGWTILASVATAVVWVVIVIFNH
jgi:hypothetical protein